MNYGELNSLLSTLLADSSNNFYTAAERKQAINQACSQMNSELHICVNVVNITVTPIDDTVGLPVDFVCLSRSVDWIEVGSTLVTALRNTSISRIRSESADWANQRGTPEQYLIEGGRLLLTPFPNKTGILQLSYVAMPNLLDSDSDVPFYGDPRIQAYHHAIAYRAAWQLALKDRDFEAAQQFMGFFSTVMIDLKENLRQTGEVTVQPVWGDAYST